MSSPCVAKLRYHHRPLQQQQAFGKPVGESRVTSSQHDKENTVTSSTWRRSASIFGSVELLAKTSCSDRPPSLLSSPYLARRVDQSPSSHYRHVTSSPAAILAAVTSPPVVCPTAVCALLIKTEAMQLRIQNRVGVGPPTGSIFSSPQSRLFPCKRPIDRCVHLR